MPKPERTWESEQARRLKRLGGFNKSHQESAKRRHIARVTAEEDAKAKPIEGPAAQPLVDYFNALNRPTPKTVPFNPRPDLFHDRRDGNGN